MINLEQLTRTVPAQYRAVVATIVAASVFWESTDPWTRVAIVAVWVIGAVVDWHFDQQALRPPVGFLDHRPPASRAPVVVHVAPVWRMAPQARAVLATVVAGGAATLAPTGEATAAVLVFWLLGAVVDHSLSPRRVKNV